MSHRRKLFQPRRVKVIVDVAALDLLGPIGKSIADMIAGHRSPFAPKVYLSKQGADASNYGGDTSDNRDHHSGSARSPRMAGQEPSRFDPALDRMVDPLADAYSDKARRNGGTVRPACRDAGDESRRRNAGEAVPPFEVFVDAGDARHGGIKSSLAGGV